MIDLHIHSLKSDGMGDIQNILDLFSQDFSLMSFADHEHIFNPLGYRHDCRIISGVEICCHHHTYNIEILGYNFDPFSKKITQIVETVQRNRRQIIEDLLKESGYPISNLPKNIFRFNTPLARGVNRTAFWAAHDDEYKRACHCLEAYDVIESIIDSGGIPVLAHPMESLIGADEHEAQQFITSLGIRTIELYTPKHSRHDVEIIERIIKKHDLQASIGSDSHRKELTAIPYCYDLNNAMLKWIQSFL